jgi:hypothetical protein
MADKGTEDQTSKGTSNALPCPWCGNVMTGLDALGDDLKTGAVIECDFCNNLLEFTAVNEIVAIRTQRYGDIRDSGFLEKK